VTTPSAGASTESKRASTNSSETRRPGFGGDRDGEVSERKDAAGLCILKHNLSIPKNDGHAPEYAPCGAV
jgi:hypothetical protein